MADATWPAETATNYFGEFLTNDYVMDEIDTNARTGNDFPIEQVRQESDFVIFNIQAILRTLDRQQYTDFKNF